MSVKTAAAADRARVRQQRTESAATIEQHGQYWAKQRRAHGLAIPSDWDGRCMKYTLGRAALATACTQPGFTIESVPDVLRAWLTHPLHDRPATNDDLREMLP